ncbi:SctK family type III secretion system sorting platform protein [Shewanella woodyi]|uniref:SctK family type III secretion system sorting platform protein n=1 Tax=Shewanella woodyi TaxID=60961 RepID=UPI00374882D2
MATVGFSAPDYETSLHEYLFRPLSYIDESWLAHLSYGRELSRLPDWRNNPKLNEWVLEVSGMNPLVIAEYSHPVRCIALLPTKDLRLLLHYIGVSLHRQSCKQVILKLPRQRLLERMGESSYQFCMNQTQFLLSSWPNEWAKTLPYSIPDDYFEACGVTFVASLLEPSQLEMIKGLRFKLPHAFDLFFDQANDVKIEDRVLAYQLIKKISKRVIPQCVHLLK